MTPQGKEAVSTGGKPPADYSANPLFKTAAAGSACGAVELFRDSPPALLSAEPFYSKGKLAGVLVVRLSLAGLDKVVRISRSGYEEGETAVADEAGMIIADSKGAAAQNPGARASQEIFKLKTKAFASGSGGGTLKLAGGKKFLVGTAPVAGTAWWVYESEPARLVSLFPKACSAKAALAAGIVLLAGLAFLTERLARRLLWK